LENAVGWVIGLVRSFEDETAKATRVNTAPLAVNKQQFCDYALSLKPIADAVNFSKLTAASTQKVAETGDECHRLLEFGEFKEMSWCDMWNSQLPAHRRYIDKFILPKKDVQAGTRMDDFRKYCMRQRQQQTVSISTTSTTLPTRLFKPRLPPPTSKLHYGPATSNDYIF